jgi:hypothetical protein
MTDAGERERIRQQTIETLKAEQSGSTTEPAGTPAAPIHVSGADTRRVLAGTLGGGTLE